MERCQATTQHITELCKQRFDFEDGKVIKILKIQLGTGGKLEVFFTIKLLNRNFRILNISLLVYNAIFYFFSLLKKRTYLSFKQVGTNNFYINNKV